MKLGDLTYFLVVTIFIISFIASVQALDSLGTFKQNQPVRVTQVCQDATYINISSISYPNSTTIVSNMNMTSAGNGEYYYLLNTTNLIGRYDIRGISDGCDKTFATYFMITATGTDYNQSKSGSYTLIFIFTLLIFAGLLWVGIVTPSKNRTDEMTGYVIAVSNLKYVKFICIGLAYLMAVVITYLAWMISFAYLDFPFLSSILQFIFYTLAIATLPIFILFVFVTIANLVRDNKIGEALSRGFTRVQ